MDFIAVFIIQFWRLTVRTSVTRAAWPAVAAGATMTGFSFGGCFQFVPILVIVHNAILWRALHLIAILVVQFRFLVKQHRFCLLGFV